MTIWAALSILGALLVCYGNTFHSSWHYDDYHNIVNNERVHMTEWSWDQAFAAMRSGPSYQIIARPLARLSFALNHRIGQLDTFGYHVVNFVVHWLCALLLFLFIRGTLALPVFQGRYRSRATPIAWMAAVFWACHPIQVTAVTYIVQRMTSLAGLFYLSAMVGYMVGRSSERTGRQWAGFGLCGLSCIAAMLSKENSVLLLYALLLYDLFFFQSMDKASIKRSIVLGLAVSALIGGVSFFYMDVHQLFSPYLNRPFTMMERLMTQPRVLFIYLSLIAVPMTSRMSILHDIDVSHGPFEPWTALPAIAGIICAVLALCLLARKHRLFAFCGLFFFLNQSVESSFLNLEIAYEHRNYVPSMLIFLPVAVAIIRSFDHFYYRRAFRTVIAAAVAVWVAGTVHTAWSYNSTFRNVYQLWNHTLSVYPRLSLPYVYVGEALWEAGKRETGYELIRKGIEYDNFKNLYQKGIVYNTLGGYAIEETGDLRLAKSCYQEAVRYYGSNPRLWHELAEVKMRLGDFDSASDDIEYALERWPTNGDLVHLKLVNDLKMGRYEEARDASEKLLKKEGLQYHTLLMANAESHRRLGDYRHAVVVWRRLLEKDPDNMAALMALIELSLIQGKGAATEYVERLLRLQGVKEIGDGAAVTVKDANIMPYVPDIGAIRRAIDLFHEQKPPTVPH